MPLCNVLKDILEHKNTVCGLCLKEICTVDYEPVHIYDEVHIGDYCTDGLMDSVLMSTMIEYLFPDLACMSTAVCRNCVRSTVQAYTFKETCAQAAHALTKLIDSLNNSLHMIDIKPTTDRSRRNRICRIFISTRLNSSHSMVFYCKKEKLSEKNAYSRFRNLSNPQTYICDSCGLKCKSKGAIKRHLQVNCKLAKENKKTCEVCGKTFQRDLFKEHQETCSTNDSFENNDFIEQQDKHGRKKSNRKYMCSHCGKTVSNLSEHMKTHNSNSKYSCPMCEKKYRSKWSWKYHIENQSCTKKVQYNAPQQKYQCSVCDSKFGSWERMTYHMKIHSKNKDDYFECHWCKKRCTSKAQLDGHIVKHTRDKKWKCDICGGRYVTKASLTYHTRIHTGEKPFQCNICESAFLSASRLKIHMRMNHLPPQLQCKFCVKMFKTHGQLCKHRRRHFNPSSSLYLGKDKAELYKDQCYIRPPNKFKADISIDVVNYVEVMSNDIS